METGSGSPGWVVVVVPTLRGTVSACGRRTRARRLRGPLWWAQLPCSHVTEKISKPPPRSHTILLQDGGETPLPNVAIPNCTEAKQITQQKRGHTTARRCRNIGRWAGKPIRILFPSYVLRLISELTNPRFVRRSGDSSGSPETRVPPTRVPRGSHEGPTVWATNTLTPNFTVPW